MTSPRRSEALNIADWRRSVKDPTQVSMSLAISAPSSSSLSLSVGRWTTLCERDLMALERLNIIITCGDS